MGYKYEEEIENHIICAPVHVDDEVFNELKEVYAKAKKLDKINELTDVPMNIEQDKTMIEVNKILNEYTR